MIQQSHYMYLKKKNKTLIPKDTCTPKIKPALFTIGKIWKQPKCLSHDLPVLGGPIRHGLVSLS